MSSTSYRIAAVEKSQHIVVHILEPLNRLLAQKIVKEMLDLDRAHGWAKYLFDLREAPMAEQAAEIYFFAYRDLVDLDLPRMAKLSLLTKSGDRSHDFLVTALKNAGYDIRAFTDEDLAAAWLVAR
jgi:hypothetical protein